MTGAREETARAVQRPAATFKVRRRRLSPKRQAELEVWRARWALDVDGPPLDWTEVFDRVAGVVLDVGFGHGESTIEMARRRPDLGVVGVEVHDPGVVTVLDAIENGPLPHVRVVHGDLLPFLDRISAASLAGVRVFFPDPWVKARQSHRRLIRDDVVAAFVDRLGLGGEIHLATDITDYADQMQRVCDAEPRIVGGIVNRPAERPRTRFERRGIEAGRTATDLRYERIA
jgi:tRNA (guanine-N7-)-methyltransferase